MRVLHSAWLVGAGRLVLWAENGSRPRTAAPRRGRPPRHRRPVPHPFVLGHEGIRLATAEIGGIEADDLIVKADEVELLLRLPGGAAGPVGSPLLEDEPAPPDRPGSSASPSPGSGEPLAEWTAPGLALEPGDGARLALALCAADPWSAVVTGEPDVALATDLRFAARAADLVLELITRGRVLPDLELTTAGRRAQWRPLVDRNDRGRIEALCWNLPASFACACTADEGHRPGTASDPPAPPDVVRSYMWSVTDALTRRFMADRPPAKPLPGRRRRPPRAGAVEAWLAALTSPDGAAGSATPDDLDVPAAEDESLAEALRAWHATADTAAEAVRTCFRIQPPTVGNDEIEGEDAGNRTGDATDAHPGPPRIRKRGRRPSEPAGADDWRIEFALQAVDDPSLIVPAPAVWADGPELTALERHVAHPDELLLRGLGLAARLVPSLGSALATATPSEQVTDAAGVLTFLRDGAPVLEEAGFGVLAPPWWRATRTRLGLRLKAKTRSAGGSSTTAIGLDGLCDVRWEVALGDDRLDLAELRALARLKQPLVRVRGQWVELREGDIEAAIAAVGKKGTATRMPAGEVLRAALGLMPTFDGDGALPVTEVEADGWLGGLLAGAEDRRLQSLPTPDGFAGELRPYQERGLGWLAFLGDLGLGACLADDMGLGKTAQLLALLVDERARIPHFTGPTLVVCPMSLVGNWQREAARFAPDLSVYVHHGPDRLDGKVFTRQAKKAELVLTTYGLVARDQQLLATVPWRRLVLDEAQQIKNSAARTTQSVRAIPAERRIAMTGTPVENRLAELWSIMQFLNPGLLGSENSFRERFAIPIERLGDDEAAAHLRRITAPFVLRRLKTDRTIIADLPDKIEMKEFCTLTREQATLYQAVVDDMLDRIDNSEGMERRGLVLATMMKLKQVCNHPAHFLADGSALPGRSGKLTRLVEVLEEAVQEGDRALVFTQFTEMGDMLERYLRRHLACEVLWLHGGVPKKKRDAMVERFQGAEGPPVFLLSLKAGGTGLNLTAATHVVHFDRWWNPAVENQATDRAFRIGQQRNVQVRKFICGGTLEERIDAMIEAKRALAERIVGSGEGWITEMSTEQLREVIALSADAVGED
ncbi:MAG: DEAD/DEAH box helicase [Acidimicrobiales bacterium]